MSLSPPPQTGSPFDRWVYLLWKYVMTLFIAPSQAGNSGKFLTTDGTTTSWASVSSGGATSNVINSDTTISADTSYVVVGYLTVNANLDIQGNVGII